MIKLFDYQREAVNKMHSGCVLCGGVGSGKSITALAFYFEKICGGVMEPAYRPPKYEVPLYIITVAKKRDNGEWRSELLPFRLRKEVVIDSWNNIEKYRNVTNAFFIFDEQRVVSFGTWADSFIFIAKRNRWIMLSATPGDTWMDYGALFLANGFYRNKTEFIKKHVVYSRFSNYPRVERYVDEAILQQHRDEILVDMEFLRPTKRHDVYISVGYDKKAYEVVEKRRWNASENRPIRDAAEMCALMRRCINNSEDRLEKLKTLLLIRPKVIIFYNYNYELESLRKLMHKLGREFGEWNGHKHEEIPDTEEWCYLVQYTAGAEGWNCVKTDTIIFYSENYSYKIMEQARGRIDRVNTPFKDLYYYHLTSDSSIDKAIGRALGKKKTFNLSRFGEDHGFEKEKKKSK